MVAVKLFSANIKTLHSAAALHFDGLCNSILLQYNENGETQIFIFYELPTLFVFLCYFVGSVFNGNHVYYLCITELHCIVVIEVIFLFRVARDVYYPPLVQDYPKTSQNRFIQK